MTANPDGTYALSGTADRMAVYSVMYAPIRNTYDRPRAADGTNGAIWLGGPLQRAIDETGATQSLWVYKFGKPYVYRVGNDAATNARFTNLFSQGVISMGTIVLVVRDDGTASQLSVRELMMVQTPPAGGSAPAVVPSDATAVAVSAAKEQRADAAGTVAATSAAAVAAAEASRVDVAPPPAAAEAPAAAGDADAGGTAGAFAVAAAGAGGPTMERDLRIERRGAVGAAAPAGRVGAEGGAFALLVALWLAALAGGGLIGRGGGRASAHAAQRSACDSGEGRGNG